MAGGEDLARRSGPHSGRHLLGHASGGTGNDPQRHRLLQRHVLFLSPSLPCVPRCRHQGRRRSGTLRLFRRGEGKRGHRGESALIRGVWRKERTNHLFPGSTLHIHRFREDPQMGRRVFPGERSSPSYPPLRNGKGGRRLPCRTRKTAGGVPRRYRIFRS